MQARASIPPSLPRPNPTSSYWQDPPDEISDLRSTPELPKSADYVVVGSGISGAFIALGILERKPDASIVMLEARGACSGATGRNGGHTKAASYRSFPSLVTSHGLSEALKNARMEYDNIVATHAFAAKYNIPCESRPCDTVDIVYDQATFDAGVAAVKLIRDKTSSDDPVANYEIFHAEAAKKTFLAPDDKVVGAFRYLAGSISAYKFVCGVLKICLKKELNLQTFTPVEDISKGEDGKWTAKTGRGSIQTKNLVLATNGYSAHLQPHLLGKIVPIRGQITAHRPGPKLKTLAPKGLPTTYSFIYTSGYEYMIPRPDLPSTPAEMVGDIVIGGGLGMLSDGGMSEYGETDDTALNPENSKYLGETTKRYFGENWGDDDPAERVRKEWTGVMGFTGDGLPFVGPVPGEEGLWISAGFNGHGMVLCLKSAEALVHMILGDEKEEFEWFPDAFLITEKRLKQTEFKGYIQPVPEESGPS